MNNIDAKELRTAFGSYMTGVTVATAQASDGSYVGFTANSFTSVSMDPPLLLVCPGNHLSSLSVFEEVEHFAINILSHGQESVSNLFASSKTSRFEQLRWEADEHGSPILNDVAASFSCVVHQRITAGDHMILIGRVTGFSNTKNGGLGYCRSGYFSLEKERQADMLTRSGLTGFAGAIIQYQDTLLLQLDDNGLSIPTLALDNELSARSSLTQHFNIIGLHASIGPVYSLYDDEDQSTRYTFLKAAALSSETGGLGQYVPISSIETQDFDNSSQRNMVERYIREFQSQEFGLYIGSSQTGEIHRDDY